MKIESKNFKLSDSYGFTLIELLVAITIFSIVIIAVFGIFMNASRQQQLILAKQGVADNARYAMEFMVKEIRMAKSLTTTGGSGSTIVFTNAYDNTITYSLVGNKIIRNDSTLVTGNQSISSDEITISSLNFRVNNWDATHAPRVTIFMKAERAVSATSSTALDMQMTVSPRLY